jgi:hypothetical protein
VVAAAKALERLHLALPPIRFEATAARNAAVLWRRARRCLEPALRAGKGRELCAFRVLGPIRHSLLAAVFRGAGDVRKPVDRSAGVREHAQHGSRQQDFDSRLAGVFRSCRRGDTAGDFMEDARRHGK